MAAIWTALVVSLLSWTASVLWVSSRYSHAWVPCLRLSLSATSGGEPLSTHITNHESRQRSNKDPAENLKIVGFTDYGYVVLAMKWYDRLQELGYGNHVRIIVVDERAAQYFSGTRYRVEKYIVPNNNSTNTKWRDQVFRARVQYSMEEVEKGVSILLTDVDNYFSRYVDLRTFQESQYDIYHAYGTVFPRNVLQKQGFVVCGGHIFYTANHRTLDYLRRILDLCGMNGCDDQATINAAMAIKMKMKWNSIDISRTQNLTKKQRLLQEERGYIERTGRSRLTGHTVKVWDREFAYRGKVDPDECPSDTSNWVAMPLEVPKHFLVTTPKMGEVEEKLKRIALWEKNCGNIKI